MAKIYEALAQADKDQTTPPQGGEAASPFVVDRTTIDTRLQKTFTVLYRNIVSLIPEKSCRVVQCVRTGGEPGQTTIIKTFARVVAEKMNKKVLLLSAEQGYSVRNAVSDSSAVVDPEQRESPIGEISVLPDTSLHIGILQMDIDNTFLRSLFTHLYDSYDMIIIFHASERAFQETLLASSDVDGAILFVEAEKTRWQVAKLMANEIYSQGGTVLGVVLNNRRFPIPKWLYNRI